MGWPFHGSGLFLLAFPAYKCEWARVMATHISKCTEPFRVPGTVWQGIDHTTVFRTSPLSLGPHYPGFASTASFPGSHPHPLLQGTHPLPSVTVLDESQEGSWPLQVRSSLDFILHAFLSQEPQGPVGLVWGEGHNSKNWTACRITSLMGKAFFNRHFCWAWLFIPLRWALYLRRTLALSANRPKVQPLH